MRIAFLWPFEKAKDILPNWRDGHRAAIEELGKHHTVEWFLGEDCNQSFNDYDFVLVWDDGTKPVPDTISRRGLMLTTENTIYHPNIRQYDVVYCESKPIKDKVRALGMRAIVAMGTDTTYFSPVDRQKDIEYFYPATFSPWKRQSSIAYLGNALFCVGTMQPDGQDELKACLDNGVSVEVGYLPVETIRGYYARTHHVMIPAIHGSERTVLESMSMGILPEVNSENIKAYSYIIELEQSGLSPREFVLTYYSEFTYCDALRKGIES